MENRFIKNRNDVFRSIGMSLGKAVSRVQGNDFRVVMEDGQYQIKSALYHIHSSKAQYIVSIKQARWDASSIVTIARNDLQTHQVRLWTIEAKPTVSPKTRSNAPNIPIHESMDMLCPAQLSMFDDAAAKPAFDLLWDAVPHASIDLDNPENSTKETTKVTVIYKSEQTFISSVPHKILVFKVEDCGSRNDTYALALKQPECDHNFKKLMALYRSQAYGGFVLNVMRYIKSKTLVKVDPSLTHNDFAVCITRPKADNGMEDISFTPLKAYPLIEIDRLSMTHHDYVSVINDHGEEVTRRLCHFVPVLRKR